VLTSTGTGAAAQAPTLKNAPVLSMSNMTGVAVVAANMSAGTVGQIPYQTSANNSSFLSANTAATDQVVVSHGTGSAGQAPTLSNAPALSMANMTGLTAGQMPAVPVTISTSGAVTDPGGVADYQFNNASGALTFNLPAGVAGQQRCYRNATGKSGAITIAVTTSNAIDLNGANGTTTTGTLVSGGALGDAVCLVSDATNHWYAYIQKGTWTNN
jgi:hypothetical protein